MNPLYYTPMAESSGPAAQSDVSGQHYDTSAPQYSRWRRAQIPVIAGAVYSTIRTIGPTLRIELVGYQHIERTYAAGRRCIFSFWHCAMIGVVWWARNRGIVVMNSTNFDGQWTRKVIERLGFGTAQGSSTRGGLEALMIMAKRLEEGRDAAFTIDGPRGPRFVAKPGPAMLARRSGDPIIAFHVAYSRAKTFESTWDKFQMPLPFSKVIIAIAPPIYVPANAERAVVEEKQAEMQKELDRTHEFASGWFAMTDAERQRHREIWNR